MSLHATELQQVRRKYDIDSNLAVEFLQFWTNCLFFVADVIIIIIIIIIAVIIVVVVIIIIIISDVVVEFTTDWELTSDLETMVRSISQLSRSSYVHDTVSTHQRKAAYQHTQEAEETNHRLECTMFSSLYVQSAASDQLDTRR